MKNKTTLWIMTFILLSSFAFADLTTDNEYYFSLDDVDLTGSNPNDLSINGNDGTSVNSPTTGATGKINEAFNFDGVNQYIKTPTNTIPNGDYSYGLWFKSDSASNPASNEIAYGVQQESSKNTIYLLFTTSGTFTVSHRGNNGNTMSVTTTTDYYDATWHYVNVNYDSTADTLKLYVDGVYEKTVTDASTDGAIITRELYIGTHNDKGIASAAAFDGTIDEFSGWQRLLTDGSCSLSATCAGEIAELYNSNSGYNYYSSTVVANFTLTANARFSALVDGVSYNSTNGEIITHLLQNETSLYNIIISPNNFLLNKTYTNYNVSNNLDYNFTILQIDTENAYTSLAINTFEITINSSTYSYTEIKNTTTGLLNFSLINETAYTTSISSYGYAPANYTFNNLLLDTNYTYSIYADNSILLSVYNSTSSQLITNSVSIYLEFNGSLINSSSTTNGQKFYSNLTTGEYTFTISSSGFQNAIYTAIVGNNTFQTLNAYMQPSTNNNVIFRLVDIDTGVDLEDATFNVETKINGSYVLTSSYSTDISGRVQTSYISGTDYRFTASFANYTTKIFELTPIIFTSYIVQLEKLILQEDNTNLANVNIVISPAKLYNDKINNITIQITSPEGHLVGYSYYIYSDINSTIITSSDTNAYGSIFLIPYNISNASVLDRVYINYSYTLSSGVQRSYVKIYDISGTEGLIGTLLDNENNPYNIPLIDRILIVSFILIIAVGVAFLFGGTPAAAIIGILILGYFPAVGVIPLWSAIVGILIFVLILMRSSQ